MGINSEFKYLACEHGAMSQRERTTEDTDQCSFVRSFDFLTI